MTGAAPALTAETLETVARQAGTPAYVYDAQALRARVAALRAALPDVAFAYSLKANPNVSVVRTITEAGLSAEICSPGEIAAALAAGADPAAMLFVGPAKSRADLDLAVARGVGTIVVESVDEIALAEAAAAARGGRQRIALRINPACAGRGAKLRMSGQATQFGIDEADLERATAAAEAAPHLRLDGLHVYMGTRILDAAVIVENTRNILALADRLAARLGRPLGFVDLGGGFGVPYTAGEPALDLRAVGAALTPMLRGWKARSGTPKTMIELGRYVVAEAGCYLVAVRATKVSHGVRFAVCDGGTNGHQAAGQAAAFKRGFPLAPVRPRSGPSEPWSVSGPLCTPTDLIARDVAMPALRPGDLLRIDRSGAYGPTASPVGFLSFGMPAEILVDGETITLIRARQDAESLLATQRPRRLGSQPLPRPAAEELAT